MAAPRPPNAPPPPPHKPSPSIDETAPPQRSPIARPLPFGPAGPRLPPAPPRPPATQPASAPPPPRALTGEETAPAERSPLAAALPFRHAKPSPATMAIPMPTPEDLRRLSQGSPEAKASAPEPSASGHVAAHSTGHFGLSLEQYAALCAEIAVFPEGADSIFAKYGLASQKDRLTADLAWQDRLREDPALMQRWEALYLHYHEYYHRHGKR